MYTIYIDDVLVHNDGASSETHILLNPKLTLKDNSAGTLTFTMVPGNAGYDIAKKMKSTVHVYRDGDEIWRGRILSEDGDFYNRRSVTCEGALAFLNDTIHSFDFGRTISEFITELLDDYNSRVDESRQIQVGGIMGGSDYLSVLSEYESALDHLFNYVVNERGTHLQISYSDGIAYLEHVTTDYTDDATQTINFGENLLDFTKSFEMSDIATVIIPLGDVPEGSDERATVSGVNSGSIYVQNTEALEAYGRIEKVVEFSGVTDANELMDLATKYLNDYQFENMALEVSALDLHYLNPNMSPLNLLERVRCISAPHGLDRWFPITEMTIDISSPQNSTITLGKPTSTQTVSSQMNSFTTEDSIQDSINTSIDDSIQSTVPSIVQNSVKTEIDNSVTNISQTVVNTSVIKAETMQATWCFSRYMLVQFLETNFDAIDARKTYPSNGLRKYIQIVDDNVKVIEAVLDATETEAYTDPNGNKLYWTAVDGETDAYKFFTYSSPWNIAKDKRENYTSDEEFVDAYTVKVRKTTAEYVKGSLGFPLSSGTGEPNFTLGTGDTAGNGKYTMSKDGDGGELSYTSRTDGSKNGIRSQDDGNYLITNGNETKLYPVAIVGDLSEADTLPTGTIVFLGAVT